MSLLTKRGSERIELPTNNDIHLAPAFRVAIDRKVRDHNDKESTPANKLAFAKDIHRIYPPAEGTGEREVLYIDADGKHSTAYFTGEVCTVLSSGW